MRVHFPRTARLLVLTLATLVATSALAASAFAVPATPATNEATPVSEAQLREHRRVRPHIVRRTVRRPARQVRPVRATAPRARVVMGRTGRAYLGVHLVNISEELREFYGASEDAGVLVSRVMDESPAATAGFAVGDVITSVAGNSTEDARDVIRRLGRLDPGESVEIELVRAGAPMTLSATLEEREGGAWFASGYGPGMMLEQMPEIFMGGEEAQDRMREALEKAREAMGEFDAAALAERLAEVEERLQELQAKLAEREEREER